MVLYQLICLMVIGLIKTIGKEESQSSAHYNLWLQAQMKILWFSKAFFPYLAPKPFWFLTRWKNWEAERLNSLPEIVWVWPIIKWVWALVAWAVRLK